MLLVVLKSSLYKSIFKVLPAIHVKLCQMVQRRSSGLCCLVIECLQRTVKEMASKKKEKKKTDKMYKKSWYVEKNGISRAVDGLSISVCVCGI